MSWVRFPGLKRLNQSSNQRTDVAKWMPQPKGTDGVANFTDCGNLSEHGQLIRSGFASSGRLRQFPGWLSWHVAQLQFVQRATTVPRVEGGLSLGGHCTIGAVTQQSPADHWLRNEDDRRQVRADLTLEVRRPRAKRAFALQVVE